jgi:hypothetical protein
MSVTIDPVPARAGDTVGRRCAFYAEQGFAVHAADRGQIVLCVGGLLGAVTMPAAPGAKVAPSMAVRAMPAPAICHPGGDSWTFLTGPGHTVTTDHAAALLRLRVSVVGAGAQVVLPSPESECLGLWRWIRWPSRADLPPQGALLATTQAMAPTAPHRLRR